MLAMYKVSFWESGDYVQWDNSFSVYRWWVCGVICRMVLLPPTLLPQKPM